MTEAVIVSAVRTPIGTARKGSLSETKAETLAQHIVEEAARRSGLPAAEFDDVMLAESGYGGGDLARHAAVAAGMTYVAGQAVNRHCAGSLTTVGNAAASIRAGMDKAVIAGGVQASSMSPTNTWRIPGTTDTWQGGAPTFPFTDDANDDVTMTVGWNVAQKYNVTREQMDEWALRSHQRAVAGIDAGVFDDEIAPLKVTLKDGSVTEFAVDEHPRRGSTLEKLASLKGLHPEIDGFSITAGNASGVNDAAAALALASEEVVAAHGLTALGTVRSWAAAGVDPKYTGEGAIFAAVKALERAGLSAKDINLWEINEAFASVPVAACKELGIDEEIVNIYGSGCSLGHPVAASGARMLATLTHELRRRGGGIGVATMCAGGGQGGAVIIEVA